MTISIWRYSHLTLAVSSFLFILLASVTGIILAVKPISAELGSYPAINTKEISVAQTITVLQEKYLEVLGVVVEKDARVRASVITEEGDMQEMYIHPATGEKLADIEEEAAVYSFARTLHRSLFLKGIGRFFVGLTSFLLFLISISGIFLIIKRQQGIQHFFKRIIKEDFYQHGHTYFGRLFLVPIAIISFTGAFLSLFHFDVLSHPQLSHAIDYEALREEPALPLSDFSILKNTPIEDVVSVEFPFSSDVEDYYQLYLKDREVLINQYTGDVISELRYPFEEVLYSLSFNLHTGETSALWSLVLLLASISILFFIYSGFKITFKRRKARIKNKYKQSACTHVILVGSETGSTLVFAVWFQEQLLSSGIKVFLMPMNAFSPHEKLSQLIVFAATYGKGEAPVNADKFITKFKEQQIQNSYEYAVVGFGSFAYPDYCQFAYDVNQVLEEEANATCLLPIHTVNNRSVESYNQWLLQYNQVQDVSLQKLDQANAITKKKKRKSFTVISKTNAQEHDGTFVLTLSQEKKNSFISGDLLALSPNENEHDRLYSVAVDAANNILLSIKVHDKGLCSNYLSKLTVGEGITCSKVKNREFYFPKKSVPVVMIATGTGIAPFLGMIANNKKMLPVYLYWGAKKKEAFNLYDPYLSSHLTSGQLDHFIPAYSREGATKVYVQHRIKEDAMHIAEVLKKKGVIMICGSVLMQKDVVQVLNEIAEEHTGKNLSYFQKKGQLKMDCY